MVTDSVILDDPPCAEWSPVDSLPYQSWGEACEKLEKVISRDYPDARAKFSTWFKPMPFVGVFGCEGQILFQFQSSNWHRKQEAEKVRPLLEQLLTQLYFTGSSVTIEILCEGPAPKNKADDGNYPVSLPDEQKQLEANPLPQQPNPNEPQDAGMVAQSIEGEEQTTAIPQSSAPASSMENLLPSATVPDPLDFYQQKLGIEILPKDLEAVLDTLYRTDPAILESWEKQRLMAGQATPAPANTAVPEIESDADLGEPVSLLRDVLVEPSFATLYDEIVHSHSAIYLPAYFVRHLRHLGASNGLRYMALHQVAYKQGLKEKLGTQLVQTSVNELARWSTLHPNSFPGDLNNPESYLYLLAGKVAYYEYYQSHPENNRWEDGLGFHWRNKGREYIIWKKDGLPGSECAQLWIDHRTGEKQWRQAPAIFRVQMSTPLTPEDTESLKNLLLSFDVRSDPLGAIMRCLAMSPDEVIPDNPRKISKMPHKLFTVQELVMETWGKHDRSLAAQVLAQAKLLEHHLLHPTDQILKIPFYLLDKWGKRLSPAQLWDIIILMDHVFASQKDLAYRDTTVIKGGIKEMTLWTEEEYSKGASRKIGKWLYPFKSTDNGEENCGSTINPWFSVFVSEVLPENGVRVKNKDNSVQLKLRVLPLVPLAPEDTLLFSLKMGLTRLMVRDAAGNLLGIEITKDELAVYVPDGRTLRYSHSGELLFGENRPVLLKSSGPDLNGIDLTSGALFYDLETWPGALFCGLKNKAGALSCELETQPGALSCDLGNKAGALFCDLNLDPGALFCVLLKLLILNLYGLKTNSLKDQTPSVNKLSENVDALELFGSREGHYVQWTEEESDSDWDQEGVLQSLGVGDTKGLREAQVTATALVACALELFATPADKFTSGRISVLVAKLRKNPELMPGSYQRLAELGPDQLQYYLRRAILGINREVGDPDWDATMARAKREDLIELIEKLGLGKIFRNQEEDAG